MNDAENIVIEAQLCSGSSRAGKVTSHDESSDKDSNSSAEQTAQILGNPAVARSVSGEDDLQVTSSPDSSCASLDSLRNAKLTLPQKYALSIARSPKKHLGLALIVSAAIVAIVFTLGNLSLKVGNAGFRSRGTLISDRSTQIDIVNKQFGNKKYTFSQAGDRRLRKEDIAPDSYCNGTWYGSSSMVNPRSLNLNSIWKTKDADAPNPAISAIDADALYELCLSEEKTLEVLEERNLCYKCPVNETSLGCLQPYSLVWISRLFLGYISNGSIDPQILVPSISCDTLRSQWTAPIQEQFAYILTQCSNYMLEIAELKPKTNGTFSACTVPILAATLVDSEFVNTGLVKYTSSIYATKGDKSTVKREYETDSSGIFLNDREDSLFQGEFYEVAFNSMYSTGKQGFYEHYLNEILPKEAAIAIASTVATTLCILLHTKSPWLTLIGLLQIILALPWAYFFYYFVCDLSFFLKVTNVNALFIVFSLGADDIFVVVDKWKNKRLELPREFTTAEVAVRTLPDAAYSTFVTSITTAVAFFGSAVIKVPSVTLFAIYCGLVITLDYILCIALVFPALCLYDDWLANGSKACLLSFGGRQRRKHGQDSMRNDTESITDGKMEVDEINSDSGDRKGFCHRMLSLHYVVIHKLRYPLLFLSAAAIVICGFVTARLQPPENPDPPFLPPNQRYEIHRVWSRELLAAKLATGGQG
ncbi:hypothetical protein ACHAWF_008778 [Thalassiosira exigua]